MKPYYLVPTFPKFHKMFTICDTYILYVFPNFSSRVHDFKLNRKLGTSLLHDKINVYDFVRDVVALLTQVLL